MAEIFRKVFIFVSKKDVLHLCREILSEVYFGKLEGKDNF